MRKNGTVTPVSATSLLNRTKGHPGWAIVMLIAAALAAIAVLVACGSGPSQPTQAAPPATAPAAETPAPDGATLLETRCSVCHSVDTAKQASKTREQWDQTVTRMIGKGAQLTEAEQQALVDYLTETHGP